MKRNAVVIAGYYGFGNAGDELILGSLIQRLRREDPSTEITVLSRQPAATRKDFKVNAVNRWMPWSWFLPLSRAKRFWLGGGGLLQESTGPWNHLYYLGLVVIAKALGCRTEIQAMGVDPSRRWSNRTFTRWVLNDKADFISVRDDESHRALRSAGVTHFIDVVQDPIFDLPPPAVSVESDLIGLAIAAWPSQPTWAQDVAALCDRLVERLGVRIELFAFFPEQEEALIRTIIAKCRHPILYKRWETPLELPARLARPALVIGMRYHALALAVLSGRPFIGWGMQRKVRSLCAQFNRPFRSFDQVWNPDLVFAEIQSNYAVELKV